MPGAEPAFAAFFPEEESLLPGLALRFHCPPAAPAACLAVLDLTVLAGLLARPEMQQVVTSLLSPLEQNRYAALSYAKRQREWLGGRLACKAAILRLAPAPAPVAPNTLTIATAASGAPHLAAPSLRAWPLPAISISHSDGYAVAMACLADSCGIDLQKVTPRVLRVADRFALPAELALLGQCAPTLAETARLTLLWATKEALKKGLLRDQPPVFQGVVLQSVACADGRFVLRLRYPGDGGRVAAIHAVALADYFLAHTIAERHA